MPDFEDCDRCRERFEGPRSQRYLHDFPTQHGIMRVCSDCLQIVKQAEDMEKMDEYNRKREFAMEVMENVKDVKEAVRILHSVGADIDDDDVLFALKVNPHLNYADLERA